MRILVKFAVARGSRLGINYMHPMTAMVYGLLGQSAPQFTRRLHDRGNWSHEDRPFKLFCFSPLRGGPGTTHVEDGDLVFETDRLSWQFDSPVPAISTLMAEALASSLAVRIGSLQLRVEQVVSLAAPDFSSGEAAFVCLSPLVASVFDPVLRHRYLEPTGNRFWEVVGENLLRKWQAFTRLKKEGKVSFEPDREYLARKRTSKLIAYGSDRVRGHLVPFVVKGDPELLSFGYHCGFGSRNSQGFGMVQALTGG